MTLEEATAIIRDGVELLDVVVYTEDGEIEDGRLGIITDDGEVLEVVVRIRTLT